MTTTDRWHSNRLPSAYIDFENSIKFVLWLNRLKARSTFFAQGSASFTSSPSGKLFVGVMNNVGIAMPSTNFIKHMCDSTPNHFWTATFLDLFLCHGHSACLRFDKQWREPSNISPEMADLTRNQESFVFCQCLIVIILTFLILAPKNEQEEKTHSEQGDRKRTKESIKLLSWKQQ